MRNIAAVFFVVLMIAGVLSLVRRTPPKQQTANTDTNAPIQSAGDMQKDSDGDGLKDWEENLWGANPQNPDTDGDGTPDGEEITQERNPLVAGPDDALASSTPNILKGTSALGESSGGTYTDQLTRQLFGTFIAAKQSGQSINQTEETQKILNDLFTAYQSDQKAVYTKSQIATTSDNSAASLKKYGNTVGAAISKIYAVGARDLEIAQSALQREDREEIKQLGEIAEAYAHAAKGLASIPVPSTAASLHLPIVNAIAGFSSALRTMQKLIDDPAAGIVGIGEYKKNLSLLSKSLLDLRAFLTSRGIIFEKGESGYTLGI